ncbi:MAG: NAD(P)-dependent dehydrogenase (short-subunit alcohol dehydrogenase family) [Natronomonas sp.]|jgi:NAD(P)-dependent dehydrogenase (short-subunit alcohol dehydrogenase family)|uniref:SDR family NAD(P)-dependent oxidoreductase n=1 Tax=Natronomonas sp. TaxID=2184060 RepID=UPI00398918EE
MRVENETVFITGAGSGLGRAAAERFAEEGATIVAADIDFESARETAEHVASDGADATAHELDVRDADAFSAAIDATVEEYGLDILLNNAGVSHERADMEDIGTAERDRVIDINVKGVWNGCDAAIPHLKEQGSGAIVNTASLAGVIGSPQLSAYSLSKGAIVNFTRTIAAELGPHGIRANAVCPGVTDTPMPRRDMDEARWEGVKERMAEQYPLRRLGEPEDIANAMLFLASDEADWITGQALVVDGGFSCA